MYGQRCVLTPGWRTSCKYRAGKVALGPGIPRRKKPGVARAPTPQREIFICSAHEPSGTTRQPPPAFLRAAWQRVPRRRAAQPAGPAGHPVRARPARPRCTSKARRGACWHHVAHLFRDQPGDAGHAVRARPPRGVLTAIRQRLPADENQCPPLSRGAGALTRAVSSPPRARPESRATVVPTTIETPCSIKKPTARTIGARVTRGMSGRLHLER